MHILVGIPLAYTFARKLARRELWWGKQDSGEPKTLPPGEVMRPFFLRQLRPALAHA